MFLSPLISYSILIFLSPYLIRELGIEAWGIWSTIQVIGIFTGQAILFRLENVQIFRDVSDEEIYRISSVLTVITTLVFGISILTIFWSILFSTVLNLMTISILFTFYQVSNARTGNTRKYILNTLYYIPIIQVSMLSLSLAGFAANFVMLGATVVSTGLLILNNIANPMSNVRNLKSNLKQMISTINSHKAKILNSNATLWLNFIRMRAVLILLSASGELTTVGIWLALERLAFTANNAITQALRPYFINNTGNKTKLSIFLKKAFIFQMILSAIIFITFFIDIPSLYIGISNEETNTIWGMVLILSGFTAILNFCDKAFEVTGHQFLARNVEIMSSILVFLLIGLNLIGSLPLSDMLFYYFFIQLVSLGTWNLFILRLDTFDNISKAPIYVCFSVYFALTFMVLGKI